ncbi:MAG: hypothetical protein AB7G17_10800 [Phycisphaerales bacterium]
MTRRARLLTLITSSAALALLSACAGTRSVTFEVIGKDGAPVQGAHVMAVRLNTGSTPLPLNDATIEEILLTGKASEQAWTDAQGVVRLALAPDRPHLVQAHPPMFSREADENPRPARYRLDPDAKSLTPVESGASWAGEVRLKP